MDPKTITAISLLVGFATFLSINSVISNPNFNLPDLKAIVLSQIPAGQNSGFSKLLSQKIPAAATPTPPVHKTPAGVTLPPNPVPVPTPPITPTPATVPQKSSSPPQNNKIIITEEQINQSLNSFIPAGTPVQNLVVKLNDGKISVTGKLLSPITGDLTAVATAASSGKNLVIKIQNASVGSMTIPTFLLTSLENAANQAVNSIVQNEIGKVSIKSVEVISGQILITF